MKRNGKEREMVRKFNAGDVVRVSKNSGFRSYRMGRVVRVSGGRLGKCPYLVRFPGGRRVAFSADELEPGSTNWQPLQYRWWERLEIAASYLVRRVKRLRDNAKR